MIKVAIAALVSIVAFLITNEIDYQEDKAKQSMYCQMVKANVESGGEYGWPDFNKNYSDQCE